MTDEICESMPLSAERAFRVSVDRYGAAWTRHINLQMCIVWDCIETSKSGLPEQCVVASRNGTILKIKSSLQKLSGEPKTTSNVMEPEQQASTPVLLL